MKSYRKILVCVDFSPVTAAVVESAVGLAEATKAQVELLHVAAPEPDFVGYAPGPGSVRDQVAKELRAEHRQLGELAEAFSQAGVSVSPLMIAGPTVEKILEQAERFGAELVVLGSHGHGALFDLIVGSVTQGLLRRAGVPVLVVPSAPATKG